MQQSTYNSGRRVLACLLALIALLLGGTPAAGAVATPTISGVVSVTAGSVNRVITIRGTGFEPSPMVTSLAYDVTITDIVWLSSTSLSVTVTTHAGAALGPRSLRIANVGGTAITCACITLTWPYTAATTTSRPNIVLINTDDQRWDSISQLPSINARTDWARFENSFVQDPQCCPSRAALFTGQYAYRNGVSTLRDGPRMNDKTTLATLLHGAGYQTSLSGKYLNGYPWNGVPFKPPGWDDFRAFRSTNPAAPVDAKGIPIGFPYINYRNIENNKLVDYADAPADYSTDRYAAMVREFLRRADPARPVFTYFAPIAPHFTVRPADRDKNTCALTPFPLPTSYNARDTVSEPKWMNDLPAVYTPSILSQRRGTCQTLRAVDLAVASFFTELQASGRLDNTFVIFTSDNGYSFGEHRLTAKGHLYEESIRVPLLIRGPGVIPGRLTRLTSNVDLTPTIVELAQATRPSGFFNGQSFVDDLMGTNTRPNRREVLLFGCRTKSGPGDFCGGHQDFMGQAWGLRTATYKYIRYAQTGETQLFNLPDDPDELTNLTNNPAYQTIKSNLNDRLNVLIASTGTIGGRITDGATHAPIPNVMVHLELTNGAVFRDVMTDANGRYAFLPLTLTSYKLRVDDPNTLLRWYSSSGPVAASDTATPITAVTGTTVINMALRRTVGPGAPPAPYVPTEDYPR